jgi:hypothetical protein
MNIRAISIVHPSEGVPLHWLITFEDGSCQRKNIHPIHALRQAADLLNGASFILGKEKDSA